MILVSRLASYLSYIAYYPMESRISSTNSFTLLEEYFKLRNNCPLRPLRAYPTPLNAKLAFSSPH